ncbi:hypothetical protein KC865_04130 [Candidatus Kaiserbacteria bacterium]|nr:hypothetical protein [Candidatus Kaiserbacteria bacterium]USN92700.1 MAG: hypothetical protein H6782_02710 [Candidatus Nomurabacteria bacterium]
MTQTNSIVSKLVVAFVAVAMVFSSFAASASAQTTEELQQMINDLLAQVAALQTQAGQGSMSSASVCPYTWTRDLTQGASGADVKMLQQFLNADADTRVAAEGAGSVGMETEFYGPATAAAVSKLQVKYRSDILSPANLVNPTGYFGPSSRAKANMLCASAPSVDDEEEMTDDEEEEQDDSSVTLGGEASLNKFEVADADDDTVQEGDEDVAIGIFTVEFKDGDAEISRIDIALESAGGGTDDEQDPWDTFDTVSLWVDGDKVAEEDANSRRSDYLDDADGSIRFSGLDIVAMEDEEVEITVAASLQTGMDDGSDGEDWKLRAGALRYFDADGVATTEGSQGDLEDDYSGPSADFTINEAGSDDELIAKTSSNDPDSDTFKTETDKKSDWYTVFVFDLDTDDSANDITINEIVLNVATTGTTYSNLVDDAELVIDGTTIDDVDVVATGNEAVLTFNVDGDVTIDAGDRVEAELMLRFKSMSNSAYEGSTVQGSIDSLTTSIVDAEGADDLGNGQLSGAATGEVHTLRTSGIEVSVDSTSAEVTVVTDPDNDYGTFEISLDVTAFEQDVFIPISSASTSWKLVDANGATILSTDTASTTVVISSSAEEGGAGDAFYQINDGETETVTITVTYTPGNVTPKSARLQLVSLVFDETGTAVKTDDSTWNALPANTFRTDVKTIQD